MQASHALLHCMRRQSSACTLPTAASSFTCHICEPAVLTWWRLVVFLLHCICGRGSARILAAWPHGVDCNDCPHRLAPAPLPLHGLCMRTQNMIAGQVILSASLSASSWTGRGLSSAKRSMLAAGVMLCRSVRTSPGSALVLKLPQERGLHTTGTAQGRAGQAPVRCPSSCLASITACHTPVDIII